MNWEPNLLERRSLADAVYGHVKNLILTRKIKGGERILEDTVAKSFGVSRTPTREALRKLEKYGLVKLYPRRYAEVIKLKPDDKKHIMEVRIPMDTLAIQLLAPKATEEDYNHLMTYAEACKAAADAGDMAGSFESDSLFHIEISRLSGNPYLHDMVQTLDVKVQLLRSVTYSSIEEVREGSKHHIPIAQAIRDRNTDKAVALMRNHLESFYSRKEIKD